MIFLKRWFAYNKITRGDIDEYEEKALWDKLYLYLRGRSFSIRWLEGLRLQNLEDFELSRWEAYTMMTPLASLHKASSQVAEYIQEIRR